MLISRLTDEDCEEPEKNETVDKDNEKEYQTAENLFEFATKTQNCGKTLSQRDLVILYKNLDPTTKLTSNTNENVRRRSNQYVETVIYNDDQETDSENSEIYNNDDIYDVVTINKERIDLLNDVHISQNSLCQKFGDLDIHSDLNSLYEAQILFKDLTIQEQLKSLDQFSNLNNFDNTFFPNSLLDYISCKCLDDNYNFFMDHIIQYVKRTIDQLKRISNGDYLTDKAKEKWRESGRDFTNDAEKVINSKILTTTSSMPFNMECKAPMKIKFLNSAYQKKWDEIVHSEVNIRSLNKILDKMIVVEIPRVICGTYRLFSTHCKDNLIISCKKEFQSTANEKRDSQIDLLLKLKQCDPINAIANNDSIVILHKVSQFTSNDMYRSSVLPLEFKNSNEDIGSDEKKTKEKKVKIMEIEDNEKETVELKCSFSLVKSFQKQEYEEETNTEESTISFDESLFMDNISSRSTYKYANSSKEQLVNILNEAEEVDYTEAKSNYLPPDDLYTAIQKLNVQTESLVEENEESSLNKKKSPTRVRIKSPYENKTYMIEEKKRRKLLEIREKRERKKKAFSEKSKISKHKHGKGPVMAQSSNSVTKLSITNKSFYNSIYGANVNLDNKQVKKHVPKEDVQDVVSGKVLSFSDKEPTKQRHSLENKKYTNPSYYLDDTETEMMYLEKNKSNKNSDSKDTSPTLTMETAKYKNDSTNINLITPVSNYSPDELSLKNVSPNKTRNDSKTGATASSPSLRDHNVTPVNTPKSIGCDKITSKKELTTLKCRKSIEKIYDLMKNLSKVESQDSRLNIIKCTETVKNDLQGIVMKDTKTCTMQESDSGTSLNHQLSSNPSIYSFEKTQISEILPCQKVPNKKPNNVVPKVIINTKSEVQKAQEDGNKNRKRVLSPKAGNVARNPLKAISQLLHEFDNVRKTKGNPVIEVKTNRKPDTFSADAKNTMRHNSNKKPLSIDLQLKDNRPLSKSYANTNRKTVNQSKPTTNPAKANNQTLLSEDTRTLDVAKKISKIMDDAEKEARGEAVKGPPRIQSRLNSLAQPKKPYSPIPRELKYGRNFTTDRHNRSIPISTSPAVKHNELFYLKTKPRKTDKDVTAVASKLPFKMAPADKPTRLRRPANSDIYDNSMIISNGSSFKSNNITEAPDGLKKLLLAECGLKKYTERILASEVVPTRNILHKSQKSRSPSPNALAHNNAVSQFTEVSNGRKSRYLVDSVHKTDKPLLPNFTECTETISKASKLKDESSSDYTLKIACKTPSIESDYQVDIFEDRDLLTAVSCITVKSEKDKETFDEIKSEKLGNDSSSYNTVDDNLTHLENALYRQISLGTFQKRLRIKNLTLTPKQSPQQVFLLQSGDANSLFVKSSSSQSFKICGSKSTLISDLSNFPVLSKPCTDKTFSTFPIQIATIGYAFSKFHSAERENNSMAACMNMITTNALSSQQATNQEDKNIQTKVILNKGVNSNKRFNVSTQVSDTLKICYKSKENYTEVNFNENVETINYTASLDILVGLLDEIEKIAKIQSNVVEHKYNITKLEGNASSELKNINFHEGHVKNITSNKTEDIKQEHVSHKKLLDACNSIKPVYVDKQVVANIFKECANRFTNVPSQLVLSQQPIETIAKNVRGEIAKKVISEPSSNSLVSLFDYRDLYSKSAFNKMQKGTSTENNFENTVDIINVKKTTVIAEDYNTLNDSFSKKSLTHLYGIERRINDSNLNGKDFDSMLRMKRDILVTLYSILVFTVFAALSFPNFLYCP